LAGVNPLHKARDGAVSAWRKSRDGTTRTAGWVKDGVASAFGRARSTPGPVRDRVAAGWDRIGSGRLMHRAHSDNRVGAAVIIGAIVFVLWIAWTVYVWTENGSTAGLGVLITWPAVLAALALVASPFVAAVVLLRRLAADGGPSLAIAGGGTTKAGEDATEDDEAAGQGGDDPDDEDDTDAE
jgi:hypothetical protein